MKELQYKYDKLLKCLLILILFVVISVLIKYYFAPFFIIIFIYFLCKPIFNLLCKFKIFNNNVNAVVSILVVNLIIFFTVFYIGKIFINEAHFLLKENYNNFINEIENAIKTIYNFLKIDLFDLNSEIKKIYSNFAYKSFIKKGAVYTTESILDYFISNIAVYFILADKYVIVRTIEKIIPKSKLIDLKDKINQVNKLFKIELLLIIITTFVTMLGFISLNIQNALLLSALCGILDLIPYIGTIVIFIPLIIYNFITNNTIIAFGLILLYILIQIIRQIAEANFVSSKLKIHPLVILIGVYIGVRILGFIGFFIAPLYIIVTKEVLFSTYDRS